MITDHASDLATSASARQQLCKSTYKSLPPNEFAEFACSKCFENIAQLLGPSQPQIESDPGRGNKLYWIGNQSVEFEPDALANRSVICERFLPDETLCSDWRNCCQAAIDCCQMQINRSVSQQSLDGRCPITWDSLLCWDLAQADSFSSQTCPSYYRQGDGDTEHQHAIKYCTPNATWFIRDVYEWTNFEPCVDSYTQERDLLLQSSALSIALHSLSIVLLAIGLVIFFKYRSMSTNVHKILRIHALLFVSFLVMHTLFLVFNLQFYLPSIGFDKHNEAYPMTNPWCKVVQGLLAYFRGVTYWTLFCEVTYLIRRIRFRSAEDNFAMYLAIAFIPQALPVAVVISMRIIHGEENCWMLQTEGNGWYDYVVGASQLLALMVNLIGLCTIQFNVLTSYKATLGYLENGSRLIKLTKRLTYTAMAMLPVYGAQICFIVYRPENWFGYEIVEAVVVGSQGAIIAVVYTFTNADVRRKVAADLSCLLRCFNIMDEHPYGRSSSRNSSSMYSRPSNELRRRTSGNSHQTVLTDLPRSSDARKSDVQEVMELRFSSPDVLLNCPDSNVQQPLIASATSELRKGTISHESEKE